MAQGNQTGIGSVANDDGLRGSDHLDNVAQPLHRSMHNLLSSAAQSLSRRKSTMPGRQQSMKAIATAHEENKENTVDPVRESDTARDSTASLISGTSSQMRSLSIFEEDKVFTESPARSITESTRLLTGRADDGDDVIVAHSSNALETIVQRLGGSTVRSDLKDNEHDREILRRLLEKTKKRAEYGTDNDVEEATETWKEFFYRVDTGLLDMAEYKAMIFNESHQIIRGILTLLMGLLLADMIFFTCLLYGNMLSSNRQWMRIALSIVNMSIDIFGLVTLRHLSRQSARPLKYLILFMIVSIVCTPLVYRHALFVIRVLYVFIAFQLQGYCVLNSLARFQLNVAQSDLSSRSTSYVVLLTPRGEHAAACPISDV